MAEDNKLSSLSSLLDEVESKVENRVEKKIDEQLPKFKKIVDDAAKIIKANGSITINIDKKTNEISGAKHNQLAKLISVCGLGQPVLLVGMAGTGKTHAAGQVAKSLGLEHYTMSVGAQTSKSDIIGYMHASGGYVTTLFRKAYEEGGVFLMDEIDAGNANVLIQINAALSNGLCAFPDKMVERHKDFVFIASANTFGNGANRMYVGRNQLDAATLDRFTVISWDIDDELESSLVSGYLQGNSWLTVVRAIRDYVDSKSLRVLITPRATIKGAQLFELGYDMKDVLKMVILENVQSDKQSDILDIANNTWKPAKKKSNNKSTSNTDNLPLSTETIESTDATAEDYDWSF